MNLEAFGNGWKFSASQNRKSSWQLYDNRHNFDIAVIGFARLNGSSEADAISEKCRFHGKLDNREVGVETQNVFPFGGESIINRTFTLRDKLLEVCVDFKPGRGEIIRNIELETITFDREFVKCQIIPSVPAPGEKAELQTLDLAQDVIYENAQPFAVLLLTDANNFQIELGCGGDWWRMLGAGATCWSIQKNNGVLTVKRQVVALSAEEELQRRPWRFNYYIAWGKNSAPQFPANAEKLSCELPDNGCFRAPAVRKILRKMVRQQLEKVGNTILTLPDIQGCDEAGHLERPGKAALRHWGLEELFALYSWGNRQLVDKGILAMELPEDSLFRTLPSGRYLAGEPGECMLRD